MKYMSVFCLVLSLASSAVAFASSADPCQRAAIRMAMGQARDLDKNAKYFDSYLDDDVDNLWDIGVEVNGQCKLYSVQTNPSDSRCTADANVQVQDDNIGCR